MQDEAGYVKEGLPFVMNLSLENFEYFHSCFRVALSHLVSYFFFLYKSLSSSLGTVFGAISYIIYEFSQ